VWLLYYSRTSLPEIDTYDEILQLVQSELLSTFEPSHRAGREWQGIGTEVQAHPHVSFDPKLS